MSWIALYDYGYMPLHSPKNERNRIENKREIKSNQIDKRKIK